MAALYYIARIHGCGDLLGDQELAHLWKKIVEINASYRALATPFQQSSSLEEPDAALLSHRAEAS